MPQFGVVTVDVSDRAARDLGKVDIAAFDSELPAGTKKLGSIDIATMAALVAGTAEIGSVKIGAETYTPVTKPANYTTAQTDTVVWTPASGKKIVLYGVLLTAEGACNMEIESANVDVIPPTYFADNGGAVIASGHPLWIGTANATLTITSSAAVDHSVLLWGREE